MVFIENYHWSRVKANERKRTLIWNSFIIWMVSDSNFIKSKSDRISITPCSNNIYIDELIYCLHKIKFNKRTVFARRYSPNVIRGAYKRNSPHTHTNSHTLMHIFHWPTTILLTSEPDYWTSLFNHIVYKCFACRHISNIFIVCNLINLHIFETNYIWFISQCIPRVGKDFQCRKFYQKKTSNRYKFPDLKYIRYLKKKTANQLKSLTNFFI